MDFEQLVRLLDRQLGPFHKDDFAKWQDLTVNFNAWLYCENKHFERDLHAEVTHAEQAVTYADG